MQVRKIRSTEEKEFFRMEKKIVYPALKKREYQQWINGEGKYRALSFVLEEEGELIGGIRWEVQDHLEATKILLQPDIIFIKEGRRREGLGRLLFWESVKQAKKEYQKCELNPVGILIQTTSLHRGAAEFCRSILKGLSFAEVTQSIHGIEIRVFVAEIA